MSQRIAQLNSLVQQEVAGIIQREIDFPPGVMVTITRAEVADDAASAKVWVSVLPDDRGADALGVLNRAIGQIQDRLNHRLVMKFVPRLIFHLDRQMAAGEQVGGLLDQLTDDDLGIRPNASA